MDETKTPPVYTEEQQKDFVERATKFQEAFIKAYTELKEEYGCEFKQSVQTVPSPSGVFGLTVVENVADLKYAPKEEKLIAQDASKA